MHSHRRRPKRRYRFAIAPWIVISAVAVLLLSGVTAGYAWLANQGCKGSTTTLNVVADPDQSKILSSLAQQWSQNNPSVGGGCAAVAVASTKSGDVANIIGPNWDPKRDGPRPDVWAPDSSTWMRVAQARPDAYDMMPSLQPSLARSPVVIAMPRPMAQSLGWPNAPIDWRSLVTTFSGSHSWADFKHPEWGKFQIGMTDPTKSTPGLEALLAITDYNDDEQISQDELDHTSDLARSVTRYTPDSDAMFGALQMADASGKALQYVSAFPALERDISDYNSTNPQVPLVAVYPTKGTSDADYPYLVLKAPWVGAKQRQIAAAFLSFVQGQTGRKAYADAGFRGPDRSPTPLLTEARGFQPHIKALARMALLPESINKTVVTWTALRRTVNALAVIDTSGSMARAANDGNGTRLQVATQAATHAFGMFNDQSQLGLWQFSTNRTATTDYKELVPIGPMTSSVGGTPRRTAINNALNDLKADGGTGLYNTALAAYKAVQASYQPNRVNLVLLLTDGRNESTNSTLTKSQLISQLRAASDPSRPVEIITIAYSGDTDVPALKEIATATGGREYSSLDTKSIDMVLLTALFGSST